MYEQGMKQLIEMNRRFRTNGAPTQIYTVPIIFHIIHEAGEAPGTGTNLSADYVYAQINQLNLDYANLSGSAYGVSEDMGVRFAPATIDPNGNILCEPGINRINRGARGWTNPTSFTTTTAVQNYFNNTVKPNSYWNPYNYVNVWVANFINSTLLGYATFPQGTAGAGITLGIASTETDTTAGVVILTGSVGSLNLPGTAAPYNYGRTLTHELGHYFALRHIWGDATCGTDYCDDTPVQNTSTSGCPAPGTLNGCTPSMAKMFENYMDYSNDACLNTFTMNQSERCQAVMAFCARRKELITSLAAAPQVSNAISFDLANIKSTTETAATTGCPSYKDIAVNVRVAVEANGPATLSLTRAGTATDGVDYIIFPSSVTYTAGDNSVKTFTVRILDDAEVESTETIILGFNITGTGVQTLPSCTPPTQTILIADDDFVGVVDQAGTVTLINEDFGTASDNSLPTGWTVTNNTGTNKWVINSAGASTYGFTGNTAHISNGDATSVSNGTAPISYSNVTTDARLWTPTVNATGLKNLVLSFDFVCNGQVNTDYGYVYYSINGVNYSGIAYLQGYSTLTNVSITLPEAARGASTLSFLFRWICNATVLGQPPITIDNVRLTGEAVTVESTQGQGTSTNIFQGNDVYLYTSSNQRVVARLSNISETLGCVTGSIQSAGTGTASLITPSGTYLRSQKVISIEPQTSNTTASYQATFYFTTAELAAWGSNVPNLKLMKVRNGVNLLGTITAVDAQLVDAVVNDQRSTRGYASFTGNFTGGFSQFMLVSPATTLPVNSLSFEAVAQKTSILLKWTTEQETNNRGFVIERSTDGVTFERLGWIDGNGTVTRRSTYSFVDNFVQPSTVYFYRLRQTDFDSRERLSDIRQARIEKSGLIVSLNPNPARDEVSIFIAGSTSPADISLLNAQGQVVRRWKQVSAFAAKASLDIAGLPAGLYMLDIRLPEEKRVEKLVIR